MSQPVLMYVPNGISKNKKKPALVEYKHPPKGAILNTKYFIFKILDAMELFLQCKY